VLLAILTVLAGCDSADERLATMATENAKRQAEQSRETVQLQQHVAEGTKRLVSAEAESGRQWIGIKPDIELEAVALISSRGSALVIVCLVLITRRS
jgi:hypothetical protein